MSKVLVFCEHNDGKLKKTTLELLSAARTSQRPVAALFLGPTADSVITETGRYGVEEVFLCKDESLKNYNPEVFGPVIADAVAAAQPAVLLSTSSMMARDLFPRLAARWEAGIASDCTSLELTASSLKVRRPMYSGKCTCEVQFQSPMAIVLMRANQLPVAEPGASASPKMTEVPLKPADLKTIIKDVVKGAVGKVDLTEANIIVAGGRGMKGPENFKLLQDLADVLGATVGASRAVCDAGWVPHNMQVGQTGKTVAPSLYIACGISGAIQHLAGMSASKVIVAINSDADAPIFQKSTYGIVGDVFTVVPQLIEEFRRVLAD